MKNKNLLFSLLALVFFALVAVIYCAPVFSGKALVQPDIINYLGSANEMLDYQAKTGEPVYWSDAMFGGMPTYQTGTYFEGDLIKTIDRIIRFLPRPADYIFLLFTGFFILGITLFRNWKYALAGSIFFAVGAYYFIIIAAGHNAKVHTIAYFAPLVAGILLVYRKKYITGFLLTTLFMALELQANHIQMTFYLFLVMLIFAIIQAVDSFQKKEIPHFLKSSALVVAATVLALGINAPRLLSTYEYSKETTRGKSDMTLLRNNEGGLEKDYITQWSYGKLETLNLFVPNFYGGASSGGEEQLKNYLQTLQNMHYSIGEDEFNQQAFQMLASQSRSPYWGEQPGTSGPAYQGAVVVFLFILGLFLVRGKWAKYKWWLLSATLLSIVLAWGKNFAFLTDLFIDYFPMYDKFRAVSSILVMAEFTMPLLAMITLYIFFQEAEKDQTKILQIVGGSVLLFLLILYVLGPTIFSFTSSFDELINQQFIGIVQQYNPQALGIWDSHLNELKAALVEDRIALFKADTLRTLLYVLATLLVLFAYQYQLLKNKTVAVLVIACLALVDGLLVNKRYLNEDNFISKQFVENPFPTEMSPRLESEANLNNNVMRIAYQVPINHTLKQISEKDKTHYRVYNETLGTFNEATTSYFTNSIGGYHAAKLGRYQDIIDIYLSSDPEKMKAHGITDNSGKVNVFNMLNTKYLIFGNVQQHEINQNPQALGNAWLTADIKWANNANEEILAIQHTNPKTTTILNKDKSNATLPAFTADTTAHIKLTHYNPAKLTYEATTKTPQLAVFSEIYYPHGWKALVDGKEVEIHKANYFLRALPLEAGQHTIEFIFEPKVISVGFIVSMIAWVIFLAAIGFGIKKLYDRKKTVEPTKV